jgi:L-asparaginase II
MGRKSRICQVNPMQAAIPMVELWRGGRLESSHIGHAAICNASGEVIESWGDPAAVIYPRSACKMVQALPLIESGAAAAAGLTPRHLALACASHQGADLHRGLVEAWLGGIGLAEADLRCGAHEPYDRPERNRLIRDGAAPCQLHNNCSGKHAGFLTLNRHIDGGSEYIEADHPVQRAVRLAFEEVTGEASPGFGIDGCSAPNFATSLTGLARAMAFFAVAEEGGGVRAQAAHDLARAMALHPELVAGEGRASTELMQAMGGRVTLKSGAEGVYVAIIPEKRIGIALKIMDGQGRAAEAAMAALLVRAGVLEAGHPATRRRIDAVQKNCRGLDVAVLQRAVGFP